MSGSVRAGNSSRPPRPPGTTDNNQRRIWIQAEAESRNGHFLLAVTRPAGRRRPSSSENSGRLKLRTPAQTWTPVNYYCYY
ncbi:hypothetical protein EYF80_023466 [Liparis tanakae]|uniref:Uncharacterized protein n=1 Tax=Liparis tanakae TaxID=230148 RepID=A0A4Z2HL98_9TELE|nr:hypothetical protein EYF80_023466 [Liparis tanakae]